MLNEFEHFFSQILENTQDVIIITEADPIDMPGPTIVYVNDAFTKLTGFTKDEAIGKSPRILQSPETDKDTKSKIRYALQKKEPIRVAIKNVSKNGDPYWLDLTILPLFNSKKEVTHFAAIERDITEIKEREKDLENMTKTDSLTGLLNRRGMDEVLFQEVSRYARVGSEFSVIAFDLDHFKSINDTYGHSAGDVVLEHIGKTCEEFARVHDNAARIGGEEFCFSLSGTSLEEAMLVAERLRGAIEALSIKVSSSIEPIKLTASFGVAVIHGVNETASSLLFRADEALYAAKQHGRNCIKAAELAPERATDNNKKKSSKQTQRLGSRKLIGCKECLEGKQLDISITMAFQPIVRASDRTVFAYEALVRGTEGQGAGEILSQVTEKNRYTFDQTCRVKAIQLASRLGMQSILSINFLPNAVYNPKACITATLEAANQFDFPLTQIMFEVTENEQIVNPSHLKRIFTEYDKQGFLTAIDDFGAGHSGLGLFIDIQPAIIKIDRHLITNIDQDEVRSHVLQGILTTARALNFQVIVEGVERAEEYEKLTALGVDLFQGYLFARPEIEKLPVPVFP